MGYARHIGRVGALAVAMGVGVGLITTPATARADGAETSDSSSRDSGGGSEPSGTTGSTGRTEPPKTTDAQDDSSETAPKGISGAGAEGTSPPATVGGAHDPLTENAGTEDVPESEPPSAAEPTDAPDAPDTTTSPSAPGGAATPPDDPIAADESPGVATGVRQTSGAISRSAEPDPAVRAVPAAGGTAVSTLVAPTPDTRAGAPAPIPTPVRVRPVTLPPPTPIEALVAVPGTLITVTAGVVRALLRPFLPALAGAPGVPASPTTLWAVLGWVRRELFNATPKLAPGPAFADPTTGLVTGDLGARDADGDPMTFTVRQAPAHGTLLVHADGTYTYTPVAGFTGQDTFVVAVTDSGPDGLFGFLKAERGHTSAAAVTLTINSAGPTVIVDGVDDETGAVTGRITDAKLASGALTATLNTGPARGAVVVGADGSFVYTPTPIARAAAAYDGADVFDTFTVTLAGENGAPIIVTVRPLVSASLNALVYQVPAETAAGASFLGRPVVDAVTGRAYVVVEYAFRNAPANTPSAFTLLAFTPDGTTISSDTVRGSVAPLLTVDPVTGAAYLTTRLTSPDGLARTIVSVIAADGSTRMFSLNGAPQGGVVVNPTTGSAYQVLNVEDGVNPPFTRLLRIAAGGGSGVASSLVGAPVGGIVTDPVTGAAFLTTRSFDLDARSAVTHLTVVTAAGELVQTAGELGEPVGGLVVNPVTGQAVQTVSLRRGAQSSTTVIVVDENGALTRVERIAGPASVGAVVNPVTGAIYQTTAAPVPPTDGDFTSLVTILGADGSTTTTAALPQAAGGVIVNPASGTAYLISTGSEAQIWLIAADGTVRSRALPGNPTAPVVFNPVGDSAFITVGDTLTIVDSSGDTRQLVGVLQGPPVFDGATGRGFATTEGDGSTTVTVLDADGASIDTLVFDGVDGGNAVINPGNGTVYQIAANQDAATLYVIGSGGIIAAHTLPGGPGFVPTEGGVAVTPLVANPVTGGALILNSTAFYDDDGFIRIREFVSMVSPDGTGFTTVLERADPQLRTVENIQINPVTGVAYLVSQTSSTQGLAVVVTSIFDDGSTTDTGSLSGAAASGRLVTDPKTGPSTRAPTAESGSSTWR
ncbi:Ig-like domain-containing protein [Mycolicibacterium frederiksbergense]|uniref:Ig-like domain-containing protein n=1 Tax=Mycolicibacterium frederiksbergense TaxID=117567 RepID=UPI00265BE01C|nr:Ig-like domain-containing protein [Mycolicibacterium frederiksbergense]MDO0977593.1 Ig-like domain-containing protein [Mycolicibacterium frederiksbergense]